MYRKGIKRMLDFILALGGLIVLSPVFVVLCLWIKLDSKGPVVFKQKRVGINKSYFNILKFRTMYNDTPGDMPTHMLDNPEQFITKAGKFLRKTSLDELPQIINILKGEMAIIGPRPALWNQYDLIEERDKYQANDVRPGLTGWAQINGRDELEIPVKAKLDGEYVERISFLFDIKCFFGTIASVLKSDGIVEGGTGSMRGRNQLLNKNSHKKKILIVANVAKERIIKFHIPTIMMLKNEGWEVHVACAGKERVPYCDKQWEMKYKRNPLSLKTFTGVRQMKNIVNSEKYDIVHCHTPTGGLVARIACKKLKKNNDIKVIYTAHGFHFFKGAPLMNWLIFLPIEKYLSKFTNVLITINQEDFDSVKKYKFKNDKTIKLSGVGVDLNKYTINDKELNKQYRNKLKIPYDAYVLIYVAELIKNKNQKSILKTLKRVQKVIPNTYVIFVGPDHTNGKLAKYIEDNNFNNVILTGWRNDVVNLLNCADCYVASSIREGLGINLIEAMSVGIPVVATNNRGHREIIDNNVNGRLITQNNYDAMAKAIIEIYQNEEIKKKYILNGYNTVKRFSKEIVLKQLKKVYEMEV